MKVRLYKFIDTDDIATYSGMIDTVQVMNEAELRNEFKNLLSNGAFAQELVADYYHENNLDEPDKLPIGVVLDMLNDSADYNSKRYFIVQEIDCDIDITEPVHHATLLATLHKDTHPEKQNSEVIDTVENYLKDNGEM